MSVDFSSQTKDSLNDLGKEFFEEIGLASRSLFHYSGLRDVCFNELVDWVFVELTILEPQKN